MCAMYEHCDNTIGNYICLCDTGYSGSPCTGIYSFFSPAFFSQHFKDINECEIVPEICGANEHCTNTNGSYTCTCLPGYEGLHCEGL